MPVSVNSIKLIVINDALSADEANIIDERLTKIFVAPITVVRKNLSIENNLDRSRDQYDGKKLLNMKTIFEDQKNGEYDVAFVPGDIYAGNFSYVFTISAKSSMRTIMSLYKLRWSPDSTNSASPNDRVYKLFLRRMGQLAGLAPSDCGPMIFSNSVLDLDAAQSDYCAKDKKTLLDKHYIK